MNVNPLLLFNHIGIKEWALAKKKGWHGKRKKSQIPGRTLRLKKQRWRGNKSQAKRTNLNPLKQR